MLNTLIHMTLGAVLAEALPIGGDPSLWAQWGLAGIVVSFTLWRDVAREKRLSDAIEKHQEWIRTTLVAALERNSNALEHWAQIHQNAEQRRDLVKR